jgi:hypothetical protein
MPVMERLLAKKRFEKSDYREIIRKDGKELAGWVQRRFKRQWF